MHPTIRRSFGFLAKTKSHIQRSYSALKTWASVFAEHTGAPEHSEQHIAQGKKQSADLDRGWGYLAILIPSTFWYHMVEERRRDDKKVNHDMLRMYPKRDIARAVCIGFVHTPA